jgi:hypothetical protein
VLECQLPALTYGAVTTVLYQQNWGSKYCLWSFWFTKAYGSPPSSSLFSLPRELLDLSQFTLFPLLLAIFFDGKINPSDLGRRWSLSAVETSPVYSLRPWMRTPSHRPSTQSHGRDQSMRRDSRDSSHTAPGWSGAGCTRDGPCGWPWEVEQDFCTKRREERHSLGGNGMCKAWQPKKGLGDQDS